jgi:uncharacterized coiled-coil protein SlyX
MQQSKWLIFVIAVICFLVSASYAQAQEDETNASKVEMLQKKINKLNSKVSDQEKEIYFLKQLVGKGDIDDIELQDPASKELEKKNAEQDKEIEALKENLAFVYKQTIKDTGVIEQYKLGNEIYFRSSYFDMNRKNNLTGLENYENAFVNLLDLKFFAKPLDEVQFHGTLSMYKLWGTWNTPESVGSSDFNYSSKPSDAGVKVKRAYVDYRPHSLNDHVNITFGRLPTSDGYLTKYQNNRPSQSSYPDLSFNAESDGVAVSVYFDSFMLTSLNFIYARSEDDTDMYPYETDPLGLEDIDFYSIQLNSELSFLDESMLTLQWLRIDDVRVTGDDVIRDLTKFYMPQLADSLQFPESLGNLNKFTVQLDKENILDKQIDFFVSASWSETNPNKEQILIGGQPLDPALLPPEIAPYMNYLYLGSSDNQTSETGWAVYTGVRYQLDTIKFKYPKIGVEYFKGSENWIGLNVAGLDPYQKLNTRGEVWEFYWIQPLVAPTLQCRLGYQKVDREYTSTLFAGLYGKPEKTDEEDSLFYLSMEFMF